MSTLISERLRANGNNECIDVEITGSLPSLADFEIAMNGIMSGRQGRPAYRLRRGEVIEALDIPSIDIGLSEDAYLSEPSANETDNLADFDHDSYIDSDDGYFDLDPEEPSISEDAFMNVLDESERDRLASRYHNRDHDMYMNKDKPLRVGLACDPLYLFLSTDPHKYDTMLASIELREMIASTALAVLDDADKFTTIVGEDTSGRIPSLIIGKAVNILRERQGLPRARRVFLSGRIARHNIPSYDALGVDDCALLITEYINSGNSVNNALDALRRVGFVDPSVATLDRYSSWPYHIETEALYMGDTRSYTNRADTHLYNVDPSFKGVQKGSGNAHSTAVKLKRKARKTLVRTRKDIDHFAREIVDIWTVLQADKTE